MQLLLGRPLDAQRGVGGNHIVGGLRRPPAILAQGNSITTVRAEVRSTVYTGRRTWPVGNERAGVANGNHPRLFVKPIPGWGKAGS